MNQKKLGRQLISSVGIGGNMNTKRTFYTAVVIAVILAVVALRQRVEIRKLSLEVDRLRQCQRKLTEAGQIERAYYLDARKKYLVVHERFNGRCDKVINELAAVVNLSPAVQEGIDLIGNTKRWINSRHQELQDMHDARDQTMKPFRKYRVHPKWQWP